MLKNFFAGADICIKLFNMCISFIWADISFIVFCLSIFFIGAVIWLAVFNIGIFCGAYNLIVLLLQHLIGQKIGPVLEKNLLCFLWVKGMNLKARGA